MKKLTLLFAVLLTLCLSACSQADKQRQAIKKAVAEMQDQLPINMGMMGEVKSVEYNDAANTVVMTFAFNEELGKVSAFSENTDAIKQNMVLAISSDKNMLKALNEAGASIKYVFLGSESGEKFEVTLTPEDLGGEVDGKQLNTMSAQEKARKYMENLVNKENSSCPQDLGDGLVMTGVKIENDAVIYSYDCDPEQVDLAAIKADPSAAKKSVGELFSDPAMSATIRQMVEAGYSLTYLYSDGKGLVVPVTFNRAELRRLSR